MEKTALQDKGKLGAKVKVGGSPEPVQNGWVGVDLNMTEGGLSVKCHRHGKQGRVPTWEF